MLNSNVLQARTLFVGNVSLEVSQKDLKAVFREYGKIDSIRFRGIAYKDSEKMY